MEIKVKKTGVASRRAAQNLKITALSAGKGCVRSKIKPLTQRRSLVAHHTRRSPQRPAPGAITLPILAQLTARGDGTYVIRPTVFESDTDTWITPVQTARILGLNKMAVYKLCDITAPFLATKRPLPRRILVSLKSVTLFREATKDLNFWESPELQKRLQRMNREMMES